MQQRTAAANPACVCKGDAQTLRKHVPKLAAQFCSRRKQLWRANLQPNPKCCSATFRVANVPSTTQASCAKHSRAGTARAKAPQPVRRSAYSAIKHDLGWPSVNSAWVPGGPRPRTLDAKQPQTTEREFARAGGGQITSDFAQRAADTSVSAGIFAHDTEFSSWSHLARSGAATGLQAPAAHASLAPRNTGKSSVGRASDCRLQQSDGPWFDSGWPDASGVLRSTWRSHSSAG